MTCDCKNNRYQGYANRETWCFDLWLNNSEDLYTMWSERTEELLEQLADKLSTQDAVSLTNIKLNEEIRTWFRDYCSSEIKNNFLCDMMPTGTIDYPHIVRKLIDEAIIKLAEGEGDSDDLQ